ncbi:MAG: L,D-transpeptidase [Candidatus Saccharicenans sp.]
MKFWKVLLGLAVLIYLGALGIFSVAWVHHLRLSSEWKTVWSFQLEPKTKVKPEARNAALKKKIKDLQPKDVYIVIDSAENRLYLKKDGQILKEAVVSTGSGVVLVDPTGKRSWVFDTPKGEFFVKSKIKNPYWVKPDWAFIEENEPIPRRLEDRIEAGVLGDYALGFGQGYFIHGTLYTRLLGRNVTHGCVRMADKDLEEVFKVAKIGTRIYIY